jgi:type IV secretion system protein VirB6
MSGLSDPFTDFDSFVQTPFTSGMVTTVNTAMLAIQGPLTTLVVLWIIVSGILVMRGDIGVRSGIGRIVSVSLVVGLLMSTTLYDDYIVIFFTNGLPNWIATAIGTGGTTTEPSTFNQMWASSQMVLEGAGKGLNSITQIVPEFELAILDVLVIIPIGIIFLIWEVAKIMTDIVVCLGPFLLAGYLFTATKGIADRFVGKLISLGILTLLVDVVLAILINAINNYIATTSADIVAGQTIGWFGTTENASASVLVCLQLVFFLFVSSLITVFLPGLAAYLGGGVHVSPMQMANAAANVAGVVRGKPQTTMASAKSS